ncbi:acyl-ACP--UDP-N-acetylglucosamine O-acyltransferase [Opitutaceae bacterium EW11]|nr:acyl-ACP--UDP-N-acetylglucosamine O-acyltransferase [Opitutaceae bacterium EW11]
MASHPAGLNCFLLRGAGGARHFNGTLATFIHPTAIVEEGAQLGADCEIQAYAVVTKHAQLGDRVVVYPHATIGGDPQYLKFDRRIPSFVRVGTGTVLREGSTINRSIHEGEATVVGSDCFLMIYAHVGHDCSVGDNVVLANNSLLGGHVTVGNFTFVGGGAAVHQFTRVGEGAMVGGLSRISCDVAPFLLVAERDEVSGLNVVGLKRRGLPRATIRELKDAFRSVFFTTGNIRTVAGEALASNRFSSAEARRFLEFFTSGKRSFARPSRRGIDEGTDES